MTSSRSPARVFVVEDDYFIADDIARALELAGAVVVGPVPTMPQAFARLSGSSGVEVAILDINLGGDLAFPLADAFQRESIPIVFFSGYDEIVIPDRFSTAMRVSKLCGISEVVAAAFEQRDRRAGISAHASDHTQTIVDLLPRIRARARMLTSDKEEADRLVESALESAIAMAERGSFKGPVSTVLHGLLLKAHENSRRH